jgi:hypothetical protein
MSGIAKPLANFATSNTPNVVIPVDYIMSADAQDISANPNGPAGTAEFLIEFTIVFPNSDTKVSKIYFSSAALRNAALTAFLALASTPL